MARYQIDGNLGDVEQEAPRNSKRHGTVSAMEQLAPMNRRLLFHGAYCSVALTFPWRLLFHVTLISTIKSLEIKVAHIGILASQK